MVTITPRTAALVAQDEADPYRYGWRYVRRPLPDGSMQIEQVPLTLEDLLHPQDGDHVAHSRDHERFRKYIANVLEARVQGDTGAAVLIDVRIEWDVPGLKPHGPDLAVVFEVREQLIVEITSPETRQLDLYDKADEYELAGVPLYIIVETYTVRRKTFRRLKGYQLSESAFTTLAPDERGWLWPKLALP